VPEFDQDTNICVIGLGWLGQPLASHFLAKGAKVFGTTTSIGKNQKLKEQKIDCALFNLYEGGANALPNSFFNNSHLILNIPPGRNNLDGAAYTANMMSLIDHAFECGLKQLVFISTTSVYGDSEGDITNRSARAPQTTSAVAHCNIEDHCIQNYSKRVCILRPSGLVGANRHPAISLSGKAGIALGNNPVNLVHRDDVISAIDAIISKNIVQKALNLSSLEHPCRSDYYTWCAQQLGLRIPLFERDERPPSAITSKKIRAQETYAILGIKPKYPSPYDMLSVL